MVIWQLAPVQAPLKPPKSLDAAGVAVRVVPVPIGKVAEHVPEVTPAVMVQLISPEPEVTVPLPLPPPATVTLNCLSWNAATTLRGWSMVTWQVVPVQAPLKPPKSLLDAGVAASETAVP